MSICVVVVVWKRSKKKKEKISQTLITNLSWLGTNFTPLLFLLFYNLLSCSFNILIFINTFYLLLLYEIAYIIYIFGKLPKTCKMHYQILFLCCINELIWYVQIKVEIKNKKIKSSLSSNLIYVISSLIVKCYISY